MNRRHLLKAAPVAAALVAGGGAGAAAYAVASGGPGTTTTVVASVPAQPAAARATATPLTQLYDSVTPGVVDIDVTASGGGNGSGSPGFGGPFGAPQQRSQAEGSGFVYDAAGHIVTNEHVVSNATSVKVNFKDGKTYPATVVGSDASSDVAVLKVDAPASELHPLALGSSAAVQPGEEVVAIGSPYGLPESMTAGIVSAVDRTITAPNNYSISGAIQTDAAINHGNSGGPLLDTSGKVIGINAQIDSGSGDNSGVGFALPIDSVKKVVDTIISGGTVQHAYLGIQVGDAPNGGAQVASVVSGSPADTAGLKAGDVITELDGKAIGNADDLTAAMNAKAPNDTVTLTVRRGGKALTLTVTLGKRPS